MDVDGDRIRQKLSLIEEETRALRTLASSLSPQDFLSDFWLTRGAKYSLQTAIEAMIDVAYHICAKAFRHAPADAQDALAVLAQRGILCASDTNTYADMVKFRNRLVHGYDRIDDRKIFDIMGGRLEDFRRFITGIRTYLDRQEGAG